MRHYVKLDTPGVEARVSDGKLYVRVTDLNSRGMLKKGGHIDRVYAIPFSGTLVDAVRRDRKGISDIERCIKHGKRTRKGYLIR
jgi:hypothetical protein